MNIIQFHYFRYIKFYVIAVTAFSLFACDDILAVLKDIKSHTFTSSDDDSKEKKARKEYELKKQSDAWLSSHLFAGSINKPGHKDGKGSAALFSRPLGMTADSEGNIYIADSGNHVIRKVTPKGEVTTWAGTPNKKGVHDGMRKDALFNNPTNVLMNNDAMYVIDTDNHRIRTIISEFVNTAVGSERGYQDNLHGTTDVLFDYPQGFPGSTWSEKSMKHSDPHKKYGDHTHITIYDGPNPQARRWRGIVLKGRNIRRIETIKESVRLDLTPVPYRENGIMMFTSEAIVILDPTMHALFKFNFKRDKK